jgi:hypothetical protein
MVESDKFLFYNRSRLLGGISCEGGVFQKLKKWRGGKTKVLPFFICCFLVACGDSPEWPPNYITFMRNYHNDFSVLVDSINNTYEIVGKRTDSSHCREFKDIIDTAYRDSNSRWAGRNFFVNESFEIVDTLIFEHLKDKIKLDCSPSAIEFTYGPFTVNVFFEISPSMHGYVNGDTEFRKNHIYDLLLAIKSDSAFKKINAKYISGIVDSMETFTMKDGVAREKIRSFVDKHLSVDGFRKGCLKKGTNCDRTIMEAVIDSARKLQNNSTISILISDFIFSPKNKGNLAVTLKEQQISIADAFKEEENMQVAIYRFVSNFDGIYYDINDQTRTKKTYKELTKRPYFIWFFGTEPQLKSILAIVDKSDTFKSSPESKVYVSYDKENQNFDVEKYSTDNDAVESFYRVDSNNAYPLQEKTFGFKYLLEGVKNAYERQKR